MGEPPIKEALESPELTNNPPQVQSRLNACLASDPSHITPGQSGDHVKIIQQVLKKIRLRMPELDLPEIKDRDGVYGPGTSAAVLKYKSKKSIVRRGQPLDPIVGRMTLTSLDND